MPLYEYVCRQCSHSFEFLTSGNQRLKCPQCDSGKLDKQLSAFSPSVKGGDSRPASKADRPCGSCGVEMRPGSLPCE